MEHLLKNKWGITLLEGMIALGLLALAATASFGVLLSVSRKSSRPDIQEEMQWAIERAGEGLQLYNGYSASDIATWPDELKGLCGANESLRDSDPLATSTTHTITCMLPPICDPATSSFTYEVSSSNFTGSVWTNMASQVGEMVDASDLPADYNQRKNISFNITCNGFTL